MTWLVSYLSSGAVKGIGPKTAERICNQLGDNAMHMICNDPSGTANTCGISLDKALALQSAMSIRADSQEVFALLMGNGVTKYVATKVIEHYGKRALGVVQDDPYQLAREVHGIGFVTADKIAEKLGFEKGCPQRIKAGVHYALEMAALDGHCWLTTTELIDKAASLLGIVGADILPLLGELEDDGIIQRRDDGIWLDRLYRGIKAISNFIIDRHDHNPEAKHSLDAAELNGLIAHFAQYNLTNAQKTAISAAFQGSLSVITGGPGCGKTTIIQTIARIAERMRLRLALTAPTGRAAQRMGEVCLMPASTIHRLLKFDPFSQRFAFNALCPLPYDMVIVDETSMLDVMIAKALFAAIAPGTTVVLVGDKDQLPSVGPGRVFADIIATEKANVTTLDKVFRQREGSEIGSVAMAINAGVMPNFEGNSEAIFIPRIDAEATQSLICDMMADGKGYSLSDMIVLTASNGGAIGVDALNARLQARLNPSGKELRFGETTFRVGDKVCQRKNNYQIHKAGVFNGDMGTIVDVNPHSVYLSVQLWDNRVITYDKKGIAQLALAYATTVHRAQGSETPCVILAIQDYQYTLLERRLIYTAITRAKKQLYIVGSKKALEIGIKRSAHRNSGLLC